MYNRLHFIEYFLKVDQHFDHYFALHELQF